jgi:hypothetical protein
MLVSPWAAAEALIHDPVPSAPIRASPLVRFSGFGAGDVESKVDVAISVGSDGRGDHHGAVEGRLLAL